MGGGDGHKTAEGKYFHGGRWRSESEWPLSRAQTHSLYLNNNHALTSSTSTSAHSSESFIFDPENPVPTIGGSLCGLMEMPQDAGNLDDMWARFLSPVLKLRHIVGLAAADQRESVDLFGAQIPNRALADRPDVVIFESAPLENDTEVTGRIVVKLWVSSSALDTDFTVKIVDVAPANQDYPLGYAMNIVDSVLRMRYRNSWEKEELLQPGTIYPIEITLAPTSNLFQKGHKIRLDISSSNFPRLDVNPNTGEPVGKHTHLTTAENTIHFGADYPSAVYLPVVQS